MSLVEIFLIGVGLSMDAFAVAVCRGLAMCRLSWRRAIVIGLYFGGFQALMPFLGWLLGSAFAEYIQRFDHWVAFFLLGFIGINMIREAMENEEEDCCCIEERLDHRQMLLMAVATSIDALAVGVTFAFLSVPIFRSISIIGVTTFLLSIVGVAVGNFFGARYKKRAEMTGGIILVLLGIKILLEHMGIL